MCEHNEGVLKEVLLWNMDEKTDRPESKSQSFSKDYSMIGSSTYP